MSKKINEKYELALESDPNNPFSSTVKIVSSPLKLEFLEGDKMSLTYILAPRVVDE